MILYKRSPITQGYRNYVIYKNFFEDYEINGVDDEYEVAKRHFNDTTVEIKENSINDWDSPSMITNAIIEISTKNGLCETNQMGDLLSHLEQLICKDIVVKASCFTTLDQVQNLLELLNEYNIHNVLLILDYQDDYYSDYFGEIVMNDSLAKRKVFILNSPFNKNFEDTMYFFEGEPKRENFDKNKAEFNSNRLIISESKSHHTYFNRKLYIGEKGEIKNAPEASNEFGNIKDIVSIDDLLTIIQDVNFQKYWYVSKDNTDVCKDCEFRSICVDNRIPIERDNNKWFHKEECNYNPYIGKWKNENGYKSLSDSGVVTNETGIVVDHKKIIKINEDNEHF